MLCMTMRKRPTRVRHRALPLGLVSLRPLQPMTCSLRCRDVRAIQMHRLLNCTSPPRANIYHPRELEPCISVIHSSVTHILPNSLLDTHTRVVFPAIMPSLKRVHVEDGRDGNTGSIVGGQVSARSSLLEPLRYTGSLDSYHHQDLTPVIGREFEGLQVTDLLASDDSVIKDLAVTSTLPTPQGWYKRLSFLAVSQRGVVFLRDQQVNPQQMKELLLRVTTLSGCVSNQVLWIEALLKLATL